MKRKKEMNQQGQASENANQEKGVEDIICAEDLKAFLLSVRDKLSYEQAQPLTALAALKFALNRHDIYGLLNNENREIARDIWLRLRQVGLQMHSPSLLFTAEEQQAKGPLP